MTSAISKIRLAAFKRQNGRCYYCGFPMRLKQPTELTSIYTISERQESKYTLPYISGGFRDFCNRTFFVRLSLPVTEGYYPPGAAGLLANVLSYGKGKTLFACKAA
jgi:hypothetical protein